MPLELTALQELYLVLNAEVGRAVQTHSVAEGALIADGRPGPWEYYLMLARGDANAAARMQASAMLSELMARR